MHEVENLIPFDYLEHHCSKSAKTFLSKIKNRSLFSYMMYYDIKYGIRCQDVNTVSGLYHYAERLYNDIYPASKGKFKMHVKSCNIKNQKALNRNLPQYGVFPGVKSTILCEFLDKRNTISRSDIFEPERRHIADLLFTYSCARDNDIIM